MNKNFNIIALSLRSSASMPTSPRDFPVFIGFRSKEHANSFHVAFEDFTPENFTTEIIIDNLMLPFFQDLYKKTSAQNLIYVHDLTTTGFFLLKSLKKFYKRDADIDVIIKNNVIYRIKFGLNNKFYIILDMKLVLPFELEESSLMFNKVYFTQNNPTSNFSMENLKTDIQLRDCFLKLAKNDVEVLFELIYTYNRFMLKTFNLNILNEISLYAFNLKLFLNNYFPYKFISLDTESDNFIRQSYWGASSTVYKPFGIDLIGLDFISMYPSIMQNIRLGINKPTYIDHIEDLQDFCNKFPCFVKVKVNCSRELKHPLIARRDPITNKIIQSTGVFVAIVWGGELAYCMRYYKQYYRFEPISGYFFSESATNVFSNYVSDLFNLRLFYKNVDLSISNLFKFMLNSLTGRFGSQKNHTHTKILNAAEEIIFAETFDINYKNTQKLSNELILLNYTSDHVSFENSISRVDWAAAVTAEARMLMQDLKNLVDVYYSDTDSLVIAKTELPKLKNHLANYMTLGKLRIIHSCQFGVFLAPNTYLLINNNLNSGYKVNNLMSDKSTVYNLINLYFNKLQKTPPVLANYIDVIFDDQQLHVAYDKRIKIYDKEKIWVDTGPLGSS